MQSIIGAALLLAATFLPALAQNTRPEFEIASVKRNNSGSGSAISGMVQGDRFVSTNVTLTQMVRAAYGVQEFQIAGQPGWFDAERFDIEAKMPRDAKSEDWPLMFQALLADRFKLALHKENKDMSVLALVVAKNGPKLTAADRSKCASNPNAGCGFRASPTEIIGTGVSMPQLATRLSRSLGMIVLDKTALQGEFDFAIRWTNDEGATPLGRGASATPALYAALQEQLGLRLESTKAPVEILIIDRVQRPSEN